MPKLFESLDFRDNPFAAYVAENEPDIEQYFIRPPYFDEVSARGKACRSIVLFGARGAGKSATRMAFYKDCWAALQKDQGAPLAVVLDDYTRIITKGANEVHLGAFVAEVGYLTVEAVLLWLAALDEEERALRVDTLTEDEQSLVIALLQRFYMTRPSLVRSATVREPLKLLNQAWHKRTKLWLEQRWDGVTTLVASIADAFAKKGTNTEVQIDGGLRELLKADATQWNDSLYARALLSRVSEFARVFGFQGVVVLVDKVDETSATNNSSKATASLLYPLLSTTQLLEIDNFGWLFFLWDKVQQSYSGAEQAVRLDKIAHASIQWEERYLRSMVERRLQHFSSNKVMSFSELCEATLDADKALGDIIQLCMRSPRDLIRVLDTVAREHDERFSSEAIPPLLIRESVDRALDKYTVETLPRVYTKTLLQRISRLSNLVFTNKEIQTAFRINEQSARARIKAWEDAGMVARTGTRQAEAGLGGKPANEYSVVDERVRRLLSRTLSLGPEFDGANDDEDAVAADFGATNDGIFLPGEKA